ncbi:hypothetical protein ASC63_07480 [Leifsonia sp. Root112D2]|nr:hypothetical protein ASC63_07480 [Leifsonia sp. Root112D2]
MSLIELMVYMGLAVIVLGVVGGFLVNSLRTGNDVRTTTAATTAAQLISSSIQTGVRNASGIHEVDEGADGSQLVVVRTATKTSTAGWRCQAWYYSAADQAVYTTITGATAPITVPSGGPKGAWTLLSDGVSPANGASQVFQVTSYSVALSFGVATTGGSPVRIDNTAFMRTANPEGAPCF